MLVYVVSIIYFFEDKGYNTYSHYTSVDSVHTSKEEAQKIANLTQEQLKERFYSFCTDKNREFDKAWVNINSFALKSNEDCPF